MSIDTTKEESQDKEAEILAEIRASERNADEVLKKAEAEKEAILHEAAASSSRMLAAAEAEIRKSQDAKIMDFRDKSRLIREEKIAEGKATVKQLKAKAEKNIPKAAEFVIRKFEEMI